MSIQLSESSKFEPESLSNQLDRLNQAIQHLGLDQASEKSLYMTTMSFDSYRTFSRLSGGEDEDHCNTQGFYKGLEDFLQELDRATMIREDYRSMELRKAEVKKEKDEITVQIGIDELETILKNLQLLAEGKNEIQMEIDGFRFKFVLNMQQVSWVGKENIASCFEEETLKYQIFEKELDQMMHSAYHEEIDLGEIKFLNFKSSQSHLRNQSFKEKEIINLLEWQTFDVSNLKMQFEKKIALISESLKEINDLKNYQKSKEIKLKSQQALFMKDIENLKQHKKLIEKLRTENKKYLQIAKTLSIDPSKQIINDAKTQIEKDMQSLQQEIFRLEEIQNSGDSGVIQTKIDRLKTKQSNLRTLRVINASTERSNLIASRLKYSQQTQSPNCLNNSVINKENLPYQGRSPAKVSQNSLEDFHSYIKMQENRLVEKEQELNQRESLISQAWLASSQNVDIAQAVRTEQRNLKILRKNLEKQQKHLEAEAFLQLKKTQELVQLEKNFSKSVSTISKFISEQSTLESHLQFFFEFLDRITYPAISEL